MHIGLISSPRGSHYYDEKTKRLTFSQTTKSLHEIEKLIYSNRYQLYTERSR